MEDSKSIIDNKIENEDVVHLLVHIESNNQNNTNNTDNNNIQNQNSNGNNILRTIIISRPPVIVPVPITIQREANNNGENTSNNTNIIKSPYAQRPLINPDGIRETIAQNLIQVQNMIEFGNYNDYKENDNISQEYDMNCFNLDKRVLEKGQWVDVKDTVNKWLDAQVIEVSENKKQVKIHYNKWNSKWDEWIDTNSPRIMPFRYHTRQENLTHYNSPFPNKTPDKGITLLSFENINKNCCVFPDLSNPSENNNIINISNTSSKCENHLITNLGENGFIGIFNEFNKINKVISGLSSSILSVHNNKNNNNIKENQKKFYYDLKRLIPILDRTGRIYTDLSTFFDCATKSNNMDLISKNLFKDRRNINEDLKFFSFEEREIISQNMLQKYSDNEKKSGTLNFIKPANNFETKLINPIPNIDTPFMIGKRDIHINSTFDTSIRSSNNSNVNFLRNIQIESFNFEFQGKEELFEEYNDNNINIIGKKTKRENIYLKGDDEVKEDINNKKKK